MKSFFRLFLFVCTLGFVALASANITSQAARVGPFTCSSLPANLSVSFPFQSSAELLVLNLGQSGTSNDPPTVLTLNSDYIVNGGGYNAAYNMQGGSVVVAGSGTHSVKVNDQIVIIRNVPVNQIVSFTSSGTVTPQMLERAFDKTATISQQLTETSTRAFRFEAGETLDGTLIRSARMSKLLGFDSTGAIAYYTPGSGGGGGGGTTYTAGTGLVLNSNEFSVNPAQVLTSLSVTNPITGSILGNAATATALQNARTINGVSFDGTGNIVVAAAAGTLTGTTLASGVTASSLTSYAGGSFGTLATQNANGINVTGGTINGATVTGLANGVNPSDAVNYSQLTSVSAGITPRSSVVAATTANISLSAPQTIDGQAVIAGNRVLVKNQTLPAQNGIYDVAAGAWTRSSDSNTAAELLVGYYYFVSSGTTQGATGWFIQTAPTLLGTDPVVFAQFSASQTYAAGTGINLVGNTFSIAAAQSGLTITSSAFNGTVGATTPSTGVFTGTLIDGTGNSPFYRLTNSTTSLDARMGSSFDSSLFGIGTVTAQNVGIYRGNVQVGLFTATGLNSAVIGATTPAALTSTVITRTGTSTNNTILGVVSDSTTYNLLTLNNVATLAGSLGIYGGGGSDTLLYFNAPTTGGHQFRVNGSTVGAFSSTGLNSTTIGASTPAPATVTTLASNSPANIRTTKGNFNLLVNVKDYGAFGDGSANDTAAIAAAKSAAVTAHGTLYFPAGIYKTDLISITGAVGLTIRGDGLGVSVLKARSPSQVLNVSSSNQVEVSGLTFDGSCTTRTAGQQAVVFDASYSIFYDNQIVNSGEYAFFAGSGATQITNLIVRGNLIRFCYADGINFQYVTRSVIEGNIIDGSDDDCIALGYNASGVSTFITVTGNHCSARSDLGTTWGRGVLAEKATDCLIEGNYIDTIKQTGIFVNGAGSRAQRVRVIGNTVRNAATSSGSSIVAYQTTDCYFGYNNVDAQTTGGALFDIADWQGLTIQGGTLNSSVATFRRGIHADEGTGWAASWDRLTIKDVCVTITGVGSDVCVYLNPHSSVTMNTLVVDHVTGYQIPAGDYIIVGSARVGTLAKLVNNTTAAVGRTVSTGGIISTANNN